MGYIERGPIDTSNKLKHIIFMKFYIRFFKALAVASAKASAVALAKASAVALAKALYVLLRRRYWGLD